MTFTHNNKSVAVVILNWNGKIFLEKFLPSVLASTYEHMQVVVADNASTDDSVAFVKETYPAITVIVNEENRGFAAGYNWALENVKSDYFVLLNSDVEVSPGWLQPMIALLESDKNIAACQPKILWQGDHKTLEYAGAAGGWIDSLGYPFARGRVFEHCEEDRGQYDEAATCFWASGAALCIRANLYKEMNGFDPYFFAHQEEIDLCWRLQRAGYKIFAVPQSVVYHVGGGTLPTGSKRKTYLNFRNNLILLSKNLAVVEALYKIPFRFLLDALAAYRALFSGDTQTFFAIASAHWGYVLWLLSKKDIRYNHNNYPSLQAGKHSGSIVWDYFIKKKNSFAEITGHN